MKSGEAELGSAGEQPTRNNLTDWNGRRGIKSPLSQDKIRLKTSKM